MLALIVGVIGVLMAVPVTAAQDDPLPTVRLVIELPNEDSAVDNPSGTTLRTNLDEPVGLRIQVFEDGDPNSPVSVDDSADLVEIRLASGAGSAVRLGDMTQVGPGTYETTYVFTTVGEYDLVVLPDVEDRSRLTSDSTDQVRVAVEGAGAPTSGDSMLPLLLGGVALAVLTGVLVFLATRGRARTNKPPVPHETWWNGP